MKIRTAEELAAALTVEDANFATYQATLGLSNADKEDCSNDLANIEVTIENFSIATADKESVTQVRNAYFNGDTGAPVNPYPAFALAALPFPLMNTGALQRYKNRKERAKLAPGYTKQIGIAMGYEDEPVPPVSPGTVKPTIEAFAAAFGYLFALIVTGRGKATMWEVQIQRKGSDTWETIASATGKSADIAITPTTPGQAEQILVRVILKRNNEIYGQPSDPVYVTVNP